MLDFAQCDLYSGVTCSPEIMVYWNSLVLASIGTLFAREYTLFQSTLSRFSIYLAIFGTVTTDPVLSNN